MKKIYNYTMPFVFFLLCLSCQQKSKPESNIATKPRTIVVSIAPIELILKEIVGDNFTIKTIIPQGASPHTYEPSPSDIQALNEATITFYVSDNLDGWVSNLTKNTNIDKIQLIKLVDKNETIITNSTPHGHGHHTHNHANVDPHFWTAPLCVSAILNDICNSICKIDQENSNTYRAKTKQFVAALDSLHNELAVKLSAIKDKPIFTAHNSFGYFIKEFGLTNGGVIEESPGKEASPKYIASIIDEIKTAQINRIFSEPQLNINLIQSVANEANVKIDTLYPLKLENASLPENDTQHSTNYIDFIKRNAEIFLRLAGNN